jgi:hypothetical protein
MALDPNLTLFGESPLKSGRLRGNVHHCGLFCSLPSITSIYDVLHTCNACKSRNVRRMILGHNHTVFGTVMAAIGPSPE